MQTKKRPFPNQVGEGRFKIYTKLILSRAIPYRSDSLAASLSCRRFLSGFVRCLVAYPFGFPRLLELKSYILFNFHESYFKISFSCVPVGSEICKIQNVLVFAFGAIYAYVPAHRNTPWLLKSCSWDIADLLRSCTAFPLCFCSVFSLPIRKALL